MQHELGICLVHFLIFVKPFEICRSLQVKVHTLLPFTPILFQGEMALLTCSFEPPASVNVCPPAANHHTFREQCSIAELAEQAVYPIFHSQSPPTGTLKVSAITFHLFQLTGVCECSECCVCSDSFQILSQFFPTKSKYLK